MIDDLTGRGVDEPYRIFTSRAEYRLLLREDNADDRMIDEALRTGLISDERAAFVKKNSARVKESVLKLTQTVLTPSDATNAKLTENGFKEIKKTTTLLDLLKRESAELKKLIAFAPWVSELSAKVSAKIEVDIKYAGYLARQEAQAKRLAEVEKIQIPGKMKFFNIPGLRGEIIEKLEAAKPSTLGQVSRIPGITPSAVEILRVYILKFNNSNKKGSFISE
jgi:tRNA uridine 5-carboxymethylaminomethyl modification enzyme